MNYSKKLSIQIKQIVTGKKCIKIIFQKMHHFNLLLTSFKSEENFYLEKF